MIRIRLNGNTQYSFLTDLSDFLEITHSAYTVIHPANLDIPFLTETFVLNGDNRSSLIGTGTLDPEPSLFP